MQSGEGTFFEIAGCYRRYHAPLCRTVYLGEPPAEVHRAEEAVLIGLEAGLSAARAGKLLPLKRVIAATPRDFMVAVGASGEFAELMYAQSWALVHFMQDRVPSKRMYAYVRRVHRGGDPVQAFEELMGMSIARVDTAVRRHVDSLDE